MKKQNEDVSEKADNKLEAQKAAESAKRVPKGKRLKKPSMHVQLPFLVELTYTIATILLIVLALMTAVTSLLAGASLWTLVLRTSVVLLVMGSLLMLISAQISSGLLFSVKVKQDEEAQKAQEETAATLGDMNDEKVEAA